MKLYRKEASVLKRPFIIGGVVVGVVLSVWYLSGKHARNVAATVTTIPDPVWTRCVNVALILFVSIYLANLLRRLVELVRK